MPASKPDSAIPVENPSLLIRSRIREKRIYEARFLCRRLDAEIEGAEKTALMKELAGLISQVEKLQQQASACVALEEYELADKLYCDIERIAIDVPGLAEERKALEGAATIVAKMANKTTGPKSGIPPTPIPPPPSESKPQKRRERPYAAQRSRRGWLSRPWPVICFLAFCLLVILLFFFLRPGHEKILPAPSEPLSVPSTQKIFIKPLASLSSTPLGQPEKDTGTSDSSAGSVSSPASSLQVGTLQIKESSRDEEPLDK